MKLGLELNEYTNLKDLEKWYMVRIQENVSHYFYYCYRYYYCLYSIIFKTLRLILFLCHYRSIRIIKYNFTSPREIHFHLSYIICLEKFFP